MTDALTKEKLIAARKLFDAKEIDTAQERMLVLNGVMYSSARSGLCRPLNSYEWRQATDAELLRLKRFTGGDA